jgi:Flp pilus assembly protein TadD
MIIAMMGINDDAIYFEAEESSRRVSFIPRTRDFIRSFRVYKLLRFILRIIPSKNILSDNYLSQARMYLDNKHYSQAEQILKQAIIFTPGNPIAYILMGRYYSELEMYDESKRYLNRAEGLSLNDESALSELGWCYYDLGNFSKAEELLKKAIYLKPKDQDIYADLAQLYISERLFSKAEEMLVKAINTAPSHYDLYSDLGLCYFVQGRLDEAQAMLEKALLISNGDLMVSIYLGFIKEAQGDLNEARSFFLKAKPVMDKARTMTRKNYNKLKEITLRNKIKLVCVQYPMRRVKDLKNLFPDPKGIIFVDNETIFKDAVGKENLRIISRTVLAETLAIVRLWGTDF